MTVASLLADIEAATDRLWVTVASLDDAAVAAPSGLPGWNRAMVLTHLARNADGRRAMIEGARRGEVADMYPHGAEGRARDIEAGRDRRAAEVAEDLRRAAERLAAAAAALRPEDWDRPGRALWGQQPVREILPSRRLEVWVHHVDLCAGFGPEGWPAGFVAAELVSACAGLGPRLAEGTSVRLIATDGLGEWTAGESGEPALVEAPGAQLLAWLLGRPSTVVGAPEIQPWQ